MSYPVLFTMWYWVIISTVVICATGNLHMDIFRNTIRDKLTDMKIDLNRLLHEYTEICPYLTSCDLDHVVEPVPVVYSRSVVSIPSCQPCECSFRCMENGDCCPGSPFQYAKLEQVNLIVHSGHYRPPIMVYMIVHCPPWYNEDRTIIEKCNNSLLYPTISRDTLLTYKNKYCAACHNETSLRNLVLDMHCLAYEGDVSRHTHDILNRTGCWLSFFPKMAKARQPVQVYDDDVISTCNVTGLWREFDQDVQWACENMVYFYQGFKNPFCYICNPSISSSLPDNKLIESCNMTGNWMIYRQDVDDACQSESQTQRLFPFKNIHCMICNGIDDIRDERTFNVSITEKPYLSMNITLQFNTNNSASFLTEIKSIFNVSGIWLNTPLTMVKHRIKIGNLSNVMASYESICGKWPNHYCRFQEDDIFTSSMNKICWKEVMQKNPPPHVCLCSTDCAERELCCPYLLLKYSPYNCINTQSFPVWNVDISNIPNDLYLPSDILVIDECLTENNVDEYFSFNFTDTLTETILNIPARTDSDIVYKNISYLLCNTEQQVAYVDLQLQCNKYIEYRLFTNIVELLQIAKQYCSIHFLPLNTRTCNTTKKYSAIYDNHLSRDVVRISGNISENTKNAIVYAYTRTGKMGTYSKCNQTKKWQVEDRDIKFICEGGNANIFALPEYKSNGIQYKNVACFICNPLLKENAIDHVISTCNVTGAWARRSLHVEEQCNIAKYEERYLPFKNYYCSECNLPSAKLMKAGSGDGSGDKYGSVLFSISEKQWQLHAEPDKAHMVCLNETNYLVQDECHEVLCSSYHYLENGRCKSYVREMVYALSFELSWRQVPCIASPCTQRHCDTVKLDLLVDRMVKYVTKESIGEVYYVSGFVDSSCNKETRTFKFTASSMVLFSITFDYFLPSWTDGQDIKFAKVENKLVDFLNRDHVLDISVDKEPANTCRIAFQSLPRLFHIIEKDKHYHNERAQCYYDAWYKRSEPVNRDEVTVVDKYLLCPQLEFSLEEFRHNTADDTVTITSNGVKFESGFFKRQGTAIRICLDDYKEQLNRTDVVLENSLMDAYNLFSDIVISTSLICLALTFTTYCLLPSLQTLPGKNIMLLSFCLFWAQASILFALRLESGTIICKAMGICIHYFWLATYCAMNICSFHLFNVFYINAMTKSLPGNDNRQFSVYLVYTFGVPLLVVATTICIYAISSNGQVIGYGKILCFLSEINASIVAFVAPSMLVLSSNIVLFGLAFHRIRTATKLQSSRHTERSDLFICIRICTIVGITGPLYLLDAFIGFSYYSFVVEGINSLQGLLIFLSYVCNGRVLALFRQKFTTDNSNDTNQSRT